MRRPGGRHVRCGTAFQDNGIIRRPGTLGCTRLWRCVAPRQPRRTRRVEPSRWGRPQWCPGGKDPAARSPKQGGVHPPTSRADAVVASRRVVGDCLPARPVRGAGRIQEPLKRRGARTAVSLWSRPRSAPQPPRRSTIPATIGFKARCSPAYTSARESAQSPSRVLAVLGRGSFVRQVGVTVFRGFGGCEVSLWKANWIPTHLCVSRFASATAIRRPCDR